MRSEETIPGIEWSMVQRPILGESVSGDHYVLRLVEEGILIAAMDGLGHGPEAAHASRLAAECLGSAYPSRGLQALFRECHEALRGSRGVALTLAYYQPGPGTLQWASIGNVEAVLWHRPGEPDGQRFSVTPRGGVVGYQLPSSLHVATLKVEPGDICCLASDGISSDFVEKTAPFVEPGRLARHVMDRHGKTTDDALVLAARFTGMGP